jgi:hypothetical protein
MMSLSFLKEPMPWLYEIGMETIRTIKSGNTKAEKKRAFSEFQEIVEMSTHHPMMREFFMDSKDEYMLFRELPRMILQNLDMLMIEGK